MDLLGLPFFRLHVDRSDLRSELLPELVRIIREHFVVESAHPLRPDLEVESVEFTAFLERGLIYDFLREVFPDEFRQFFRVHPPSAGHIEV